MFVLRLFRGKWSKKRRKKKEKPKTYNSLAATSVAVERLEVCVASHPEDKHTDEDEQQQHQTDEAAATETSDNTQMKRGDRK